jgi:hypothetical protein
LGTTVFQANLFVVALFPSSIPERAVKREPVQTERIYFDCGAALLMKSTVLLIYDSGPRTPAPPGTIAKMLADWWVVKHDMHLW